MNNKIALFPYDKFSLPIARHWNSLDDHHRLQQLIAYKGSGLTGRDAAWACNHPPIGIEVTDWSSMNLSEWDTLLINCSGLANEYLTECTDIFRNYLEIHKHVVFADSSRTSPLPVLESLYQTYPDYVKLVNAQTSVDVPWTSNIKYIPLDIPVLLVGGLAHESDSLETILSLREEFGKDGRFASCVIDNDAGLLLGMHTFRHIFSDTTIGEVDKILAINRLTHDIQKAERPEIIIVEVPGTVMKYSKDIPGDFGIHLHMIVQALDPSLFVCCMPFDLAIHPFVEAVSEGFNKRYGFSISAVHASNLLIDSAAMFQKRALSYSHVELDVVNQTLRQEVQNRKIPIYNIISEGAHSLYQHIISLL